MAATVDLAQRGYSGMEVREGLLRCKPSLPDGIDLVEYHVYYHHRWITVSLRSDELQLRSEPTHLGPVDVAYYDDIRPLAPGGTLRFRPATVGADEAEGAIEAPEHRRHPR